MKDPEPLQEEKLNTESQDHTGIPSEELGLAAIRIVNQFFAYTSWDGKQSLNVTGSFTVNGLLNNQTACCVAGDVEVVELQDRLGFAVGYVTQAVELQVTAFHNSRGKATSSITVCDDSIPDFNETATVDFIIPWEISATARFPLVSSTVGPLGVQSGLEAGATVMQFELAEGTSQSTHFDVSEDSINYFGHGGAFVGFAAELGSLTLRGVMSISLLEFGEVHPDPLSVSVSIGIGLGF